jgi:outer membrane immunogenic protein
MYCWLGTRWGCPIMKRRTLAGVAALTLFDIVAAQAQTPPPPVDWSGFYTGVNVGYRAGDFSGTSSYAGLPQFPWNFFNTFSGLNFPYPTTGTSLKPSSAVGGLHAGYNYNRIAPNILVGFEGDVVWGNGKKSNTWFFGDSSGQRGFATFSTSINWQASLRGRVGYWNGPWLLYGTGGVSIAQVKFSGYGGVTGAGSFDCSNDSDSFSTCDFSNSSAFAFSSSKILPGGVVGGGVEYLYLNHWMFRVEYLYADYGYVRFSDFGLKSSYSDNFNCGGNGCPQTVFLTSSALGQASAHLTTQTIRFAVSYRWAP